MSRPGGTPEAPGDDVATQVDAVVRVAQVAMAAVAQSLATVEETVTQPQMRVLVIVASATDPLNVSAVAEQLGVHPSNATRACDGLVRAGLLLRRESRDDRRNVALGLSAKGSRLVDHVLEHRRRTFEQVVSSMDDRDRKLLGPAFNAFADAAGEASQGENHLISWLS